jgi:aminopeptidase YwaD
MAKMPISFFFILFFSFAFGQKAEGDQLVLQARTITKQLCSNEFHGRGYVNGGDSLAAAYIAKQFQHIDLKKVGKSYFQPFQFTVNHFPGAMEIKMNGEVIQPGIDYIVDTESCGGKITLRPK